MKKITVNEFLKLREKEGLIIQGCGGDLQEWIDEINSILTEKQILRDGFIFSDVFENEGIMNLLFLMDDADFECRGTCNVANLHT